MKVDWSTFPQEEIPPDVYASLEESGIYYHIAIIDYLQEWNLSKMAEKASK